MNIFRSLLDTRITTLGVELSSIALDVSQLAPSERPAVANATPKRRREFIAGRILARRAMRQLSVRPCAIPSSATRAPVWPNGIVGSISHTDRYCAVALAHADDFRAIGIDLESASPIESSLWPLICGSNELERLRRSGNDSPGQDCKVLFCAKEAGYKAQHMLTGQVLDFDAMDVELDHDTMQWRATFVRPVSDIFESGDTIGGQWRRTSDFVATAVVVPRQVND